MAYGGGEENIEMDNMNDNDQNDLDDDDDENTALLNDEIRSTSTHQGARPKTRKTLHSYENPSYMLDDDIPEIGERPTTVTEREENQDSAWERIRTVFPKFNSKIISDYFARIDEFDKVKVKYKGKKGKNYIWHNLLNNGKLNSKLGKGFKDNIRSRAGEIVEENDKTVSELKEKNIEDREHLKRTDISELERDQRLDIINLRNERIEEITGENERIQDRMSLKDQIKSIFKKHGFTVVSVITAVGAIIGVIVSNLKTGLAKMAKGVGNGLKDIGKNWEQYYPV